MKTIRVLLSTVLCAALFFCLLMGGAAREKREAVPLPAPFVLSDLLTVFPEGDGNFLLLSADEKQTAISRLEGTTGGLALLHTLPEPYSAADFRQEKLLVACPRREAGVDAPASTWIYTVLPAENRMEKAFLPDTTILGLQDLLLLEEGFACIDAWDRSQIRLFDRMASPLERFAAEEGLNGLAAGEGQEFYALGQSGALSLYTEEGLCALTGELPSQPMQSLGDGYLLGSEGDLWRRERGRSEPDYLYQSFVTPGAAARSGSNLYLRRNDRILVLDCATGKATGELPLPEGSAASLFASGDWLLLFKEEAGGPSAFLLPAGSPEPVNPRVLTPGSANLAEEEITALWKEAFPKEDRAAPLFDEFPDLEEFSTAGRLSVESREAGRQAANFYRALYGLPPLAAEGGDLLQKGAVLALLTGGASGPPRPAGMPEPFYRDALSALKEGTLIFLPGSSAALTADAVHGKLWEEPDFRAALLSSGTERIGFGCASREEGESAVFMDTDSDPAGGLLAFPPPGCYPSNLLENALWSLTLPESVLVREGEAAAVTVTDRSTGESFPLTYGEDLWQEGNTLVWTPPPLSEGHTYHVTVENLTEEGIPAVLDWETRLFYLDWSGPVLPGDVNGDGAVTKDDKSLLLAYLLGRQTLPEEALAAADYNGDGRVDTIDLLALEQLTNRKS